MITLKPQDWRWATWRDFTPLERPAPREFDPLPLIAQISKMQAVGWGWLQHSMENLPAAISNNEARFWLTATHHATQKPQEVVSRLEQLDYDQPLEAERVMHILHKTGKNHSLPPQRTLILFQLLPLEAAITCFINLPQSQELHSGDAFMQGFYRYILPYLTTSELERIRVIIRQALPVYDWSYNPNNSKQPIIPRVYYLAAAVGGFAPELSILLATIPNDAYQLSSTVWHDQGEPSTPLELIFGLNSPEEVIQETKRIQHYFNYPHHALAWLAHTETAALDWLQESLHSTSTLEAKRQILQALMLVQDAAVTGVLLSLQAHPALARFVQDWLKQNPLLAAQGATRIYMSGGKTAIQGRDCLRLLKRREQDAVLHEVCITLPAEQRRQFQSQILEYGKATPALTATDTPTWVTAALPRVNHQRKQTTPPDWVDYAELPLLILNSGQALNYAQGTGVLLALKHSTLAAPHEFITLLKTQVAPVFLDEFVWRLCEIWQERSDDWQEKWVITALGLCGGDITALRFTEILRTWSRQNAYQKHNYYQRAIYGIQCLAQISTDVALAQLYLLAQTVKRQAIKNIAQTALETIAQQRQWSLDQLEDRLIPTCGLDADGKRSFSYGAREFSFVLDSYLKPALKDRLGKVRTALPALTQKDNAQLAQKAKLEWEIVRQQTKLVAKQQTQRLERAFNHLRRWQQADFLLLVRHPLMIHLLRRMVWGQYNAENQLVAVFRVTEERDYANAYDEGVPLIAEATVGLVHPIELAEGERRAWHDVLLDYKILQPFPQLARPLYTLQAEELTQTVSTRFANVAVPAPLMLENLRLDGWRYGNPRHLGNMFYYHEKYYSAYQILAVVEYTGIQQGGKVYQNSDQSLHSCYFVQGELQDRTKMHLLPLSQVPSAVLHETFYTLTRIITKTLERP